MVQVFVQQKRMEQDVGIDALLRIGLFFKLEKYGEIHSVQFLGAARFPGPNLGWRYIKYRLPHLFCDLAKFHVKARIVDSDKGLAFLGTKQAFQLSINFLELSRPRQNVQKSRNGKLVKFCNRNKSRILHAAATRTHREHSPLDYGLNKGLPQNISGIFPCTEKDKRFLHRNYLRGFPETQTLEAPMSCLSQFRTS